MLGHPTECAILSVSHKVRLHLLSKLLLTCTPTCTHPSPHSLGFTACVTSLYALRNAPSVQSTSGWVYGLDREHTNPQMSVSFS